MRFVRYVGRNQCRDSEYQYAINSEQDVLIDWISSSANAAVAFRLNNKAMAPDLRGTLLDFTDLGVLVYLADEMMSRADATDYWTRVVRCLVPVAEPDKWRENESLLRNTLELLSGDLWEFDWVPLNAPRPVPRHRQRLPWGLRYRLPFFGGDRFPIGGNSALEGGPQGDTCRPPI